MTYLCLCPLLQNLVLVNGTTAKSWWEVPPINPLMKVHIFNYTNTEAFLNGEAEKLVVEDLGPLTYKEITTKVDLQHHDDNTITYRVSSCDSFAAHFLLCSGRGVLLHSAPLILSRDDAPMRK